MNAITKAIEPEQTTQHGIPASIDPIIGLIDRHRSTWEKKLAVNSALSALEAQGVWEYPDGDRAYEEAADAADEAAWALISGAGPVTIEGAIELLAYVVGHAAVGRDWPDGGLSTGMVGSIEGREWVDQLHDRLVQSLAFIAAIPRCPEGFVPVTALGSVPAFLAVDRLERMSPEARAKLVVLATPTYASEVSVAG